MRARLRLSSPAWLARAEEHFLDVVAEAGMAAQEFADRQRREIVGAHARKRAAVAADRRPDIVADEGVDGH